MVSIASIDDTLVTVFTYLKNLRPIYTDCAISCESLVDLAHDCDHSRMELLVPRCEHIQISNLHILLLLMLFEQLIKLLLSFISIDIV